MRSLHYSATPGTSHLYWCLIGACPYILIGQCLHLKLLTKLIWSRPRLWLYALRVYLFQMARCRIDTFLCFCCIVISVTLALILGCSCHSCHRLHLGFQHLEWWRSLQLVGHRPQNLSFHHILKHIWSYYLWVITSFLYSHLGLVTIPPSASPTTSSN